MNLNVKTYKEYENLPQIFDLKAFFDNLQKNKINLIDTPYVSFASTILLKYRSSKKVGSGSKNPPESGMSKPPPESPTLCNYSRG